MTVFLHKQNMMINKNNSMPIGVIVLWTGSEIEIPDGWHLCDGTEGTVDLRNRFIIGAGDKYTMNSTGGEESHRLTIEEIPAHSHSIAMHQGSVMSGSNPATGNGVRTDTGTSETTDSGSSMAHNNMPPYYSLYFIQKIA